MGKSDDEEEYVSEYDSEEGEEGEDDRGPSKAEIVQKQEEEKAAKEAEESKKAYDANKEFENKIRARKEQILAGE